MKDVNRKRKNKGPAAAGRGGVKSAEPRGKRWSKKMVAEAAKRAVAFFQEEQVWGGTIAATS